MGRQLCLGCGPRLPDAVFDFAATPRGISRLTLRRSTHSIHAQTGGGRLVSEARAQVASYLSGKRTYFTVPLDLSGVAAFDRAALGIATTIPYGEVRTYKWIADQLGSPDAARAVGAAMAGNPVPIIIPCHRVIKSDGGLGGYLFGLDFKQALLDLEASTPPFAGNGSTRVVCRRGCVCERRSTRDKRFFNTIADAQIGGYRPCPACTPGLPNFPIQFSDET